MESLRKNTLAQLFTIYTRYLTGSAYTFACIAKTEVKGSQPWCLKVKIGTRLLTFLKSRINLISIGDYGLSTVHNGIVLMSQRLRALMFDQSAPIFL